MSRVQFGGGIKKVLRLRCIQGQVVSGVIRLKFDNFKTTYTFSQNAESRYTYLFNRERDRSDQNFMTLKREKIGLRIGSKNKICSYIVETILSGENNKEIKEV